MTGLYVIGGLVAFVLIVVISIYNGIISRKNKCKRSWADVVTYAQQKIKVLPKLEDAVKDHKEFESSVQKEVAELRSGIKKLDTNNMNPTMLEQLEGTFSNMLKGINVSVENYPDLKSSNLYQQLMTEISELQENITAAITIYNNNVEDFNNGIQHFPNSLINSLLNKEAQLDSFNNVEASNEVGFQPNL